MGFQEELEKFRDALVQQRDELVVQLNLAKLDAREEWEKAEAKLEELRSRLDAVTREARDASDDVWESARDLGEEIRTAYERIRNKL